MPEIAGKLATDLFRDACIKNLGHAGETETALRAAGFIGAGYPMKDFLTEGKPGETWMRDKPPVGIAAMTRPDGSECSLVVQHAVLAINERDFRAMVADLAPNATEIPDAERLPDDPMRVVGYRIPGPAPDAPERVLTLRLDKTPRSFFPAKLSASIVVPPPPTPPPQPIDASAPLPGKRP